MWHAQAFSLLQCFLNGRSQLFMLSRINDESQSYARARKEIVNCFFLFVMFVAVLIKLAPFKNTI